MKTIKDYAVTIYWDERAGYFVAEIPEIPTCAADGTTQAEALANLEETFAVLKESYQEEGLLLPAPAPDLPVSVGVLAAASSVVKVAKVADLAGIPVQTLSAKVARGTELSMGEARQIKQVLSGLGVHLGSVWTPTELARSITLEERNTPTQVIGMKFGRSAAAVYAKAAEQGISLKPRNQPAVGARPKVTMRKP